MLKMTPQRICRFALFFLFAFPGFVLADFPVPEDYLASKPLLLEVRYCECQAIKSDSTPSDLLPAFLNESRALTVGVSAEDRGFVSSYEFSMGYEFEPVNGSPGKFRFSYVGEYATSGGSDTGQGEMLLVEGQWATLWGSHQEDETGSHYTGVAVRLVESGGS